MIIDVTNEVYTKLKTELTNVSVLPTNENVTASFPCVTLEEISNNIDVDSIDTSGDKYSVVALELNIFSIAENKIIETKTIRNQIDAILSDEYRMTRDYSSTTPNYLNEEIYRYTMRYSFLVDANRKIHRR